MPRPDWARLVAVLAAPTRAWSVFNKGVLTAEVGGYPVIVVGCNWSGDRQCFTLAHKLGHRILAGRLSGELEEEKACNHFAGAFLAPQEAIGPAP